MAKMEKIEKMRVKASLANISSLGLYNLKKFYDIVKQGILESPEYCGDGHYIIKGKKINYHLDYAKRQEDGFYNEKNFYGFRDDDHQYVYSLQIPSDTYIEMEEILFSPMALGLYDSYDIGITMQNNVPRKLIYHGVRLIDYDNLTEDGEISQEEENAMEKTMMYVREETTKHLGAIAIEGMTFREMYTKGSRWLLMESFVFLLSHENSTLVKWALPEIKDGNYVSLNNNAPDRKDLNDWKEQVKNRDNVCIVCGSEKHLVCHHVYPFKLYPNLRDDVNNGVVLCKWCHNKYHSYYGKGENVNPSSLVEFVQRFGTGATKSHVTTVEHVEQVIESDKIPNEKEKITHIKNTLKNLILSNDKSIHKDELYEEINKGKKQISKDDFDYILKELSAKGEVYHPIPDHYNIV